VLIFKRRSHPNFLKFFKFFRKRDVTTRRLALFKKIAGFCLLRSISEVLARYKPPTRRDVCTRLGTTKKRWDGVQFFYCVKILGDKI